MPFCSAPGSPTSRGRSGHATSTRRSTRWRPRSRTGPAAPASAGAWPSSTGAGRAASSARARSCCSSPTGSTATPAPGCRARWSGCTNPAAGSSGSIRCCVMPASPPNPSACGRFCLMSTSSGRCIISRAWRRWWRRWAKPAGGASARRPNGRRCERQVEHDDPVRRQRRYPRTGGAMAQPGQRRGPCDRGLDLGLVAAPGRRQARRRRYRRLRRVGFGRLRRRRGDRGGPGGDQGRQATPARFRRHPRAGLGGRPRLRRQNPDFRRARRMKLELFKRAVESAAAGRPAALATNLKSGMQCILQGSDFEGTMKPNEAVAAAVRQALADDRSTLIETPEGKVFIEVFNPPLRLMVVGAVHIAQPLARIAALAGYAVTVIDPRSAFASTERFPGVELSTEWPDEAMARLKPDRRTAVVTLTHDPKVDDPALIAALRSPAFYIGALGSKKTHAARLKRLAEAGFKDGECARIHGPVGLDIGATSPAEIAVSILAEITATLRADRLKSRQAA